MYDNMLRIRITICTRCIICACYTQVTRIPQVFHFDATRCGKHVPVFRDDFDGPTADVTRLQLLAAVTTVDVVVVVVVAVIAVDGRQAVLELFLDGLGPVDVFGPEFDHGRVHLGAVSPVLVVKVRVRD